jgi:hypothetical protein
LFPLGFGFTVRRIELFALEPHFLVVDLDNSSFVLAELIKAIVSSIFFRFVVVDTLNFFFHTLIKRAGLEKPTRFPGDWDQQRKTAKQDEGKPIR